MKLDKNREILYLSRYVDDHNHVLDKPNEVPFLRSHNKIKEFQRVEILAMVGSGIENT